jgi:hypothetical protein
MKKTTVIILLIFGFFVFYVVQASAGCTIVWTGYYSGSAPTNETSRTPQAAEELYNQLPYPEELLYDGEPSFENDCYGFSWNYIYSGGWREVCTDGTYYEGQDLAAGCFGFPAACFSHYGLWNVVCDSTTTTTSIIFETTTTASSVTTSIPPTVVELSSFTAASAGSSIMLKWETESETNNAGFNIRRAESENGEYVKINSELILTKGSSTRGAAYEFIDAAVQNQKTYYYQLEDIALEGTSTIHGPVHATVGSSASTTTTTAADGQCAAETIYGERSAEAELLREYRDTVLSRSETGRRIISRYYELSPAVSEFLRKNPAAREQARRVLDSMLPVLKNQLDHISSAILRKNRAEQ